MASLLRAQCLEAAEVRHAPFPFLVAGQALAAGDADRLERDFPRYRSAGFFPHREEDCGPALNALIGELTAAQFADAIGERLGVERLSQYPTLVTICRALNRRHGTIHTDSRSKVVTALVYLNPEWQASSEGCLRFLARSDDIEALVAPEIRPLFGNLVAFKRGDNSFHGHLPFEGERRVVQIAWLVDATERDRKYRRGRFSRALKRLLGRLDRWFGRGRADNAGHLD